ncbi:methionine ABC transporter ATP-binding protein [Tuberibacillus sp. Marseille-P3662]|uniref:methionine ABC transporter ATP-binding protein n=1 Tax=Tuberibacillus sp. Marseille-P3662 TaxID=1965358 RepID=UPI000A1C7B4B|nr:methionine ABC transporter ATP-binding protein [Tuberibacillus sp. Marseille-P3662]
MIQLENLHKSFQTSHGTIDAVKDVSLTIDDGEIFGIIGYSGAGKSTLIRLLNNLEEPTSGTVTVADRKLSQLNNKHLRNARRDIGMIFQHFNLLWSRTVQENIEFPLEIAGVSKKKRQKRSQELIELVGLEGRGDAYPSQLSGGQKQRVGIARALANDPQVLLCDEATSALDPKTTDSILDLLVDINKTLGLTVVIITHEMHVIRKISHRVAVMEDGEVVEQGDVIDVFKNPKQSITKDFVKQVTEAENTEETIQFLTEKFSGGKIVKLTFVGENTHKPFINELFRETNISINILQGNVSQAQGSAYGTLYLQLEGQEAGINEAIDYCRKRNVDVEVVSHVT